MIRPPKEDKPGVMKVARPYSNRMAPARVDERSGAGIAADWKRLWAAIRKTLGSRGSAAQSQEPTIRPKPQD